MWNAVINLRAKDGVLVAGSGLAIQKSLFIEKFMSLRDGKMKKA